jgi:hypothetical protein
MKISWQYKTAVISTAHVTENDAEIFPTICYEAGTDAGITLLHGTGGGWIVRAGDEDAWKSCLLLAGISEGAISNIQTVLDAGFDAVHFDVSADLIEELPHWEW